MRKSRAMPATAGSLAALGAAGLMLFAAQTPALAAADVTNFNVKNCTPERIFVCSFDETDSAMDIPYKAKGVKPGDRKEFGCASIGRCKVIIGVSKKKPGKHILSKGMKAATSSKIVAAASIGGGIFVYTGASTLAATGIAATTSASLVTSAGVGMVIGAIAVGGAVATLEIADGLSDGEVCNQVRRAAKKAGMKPKRFMQNGKKYVVVPQYAADGNGNPYLNADGTAVFAYKAEKGNACPTALKAQLVPN